MVMVVRVATSPPPISLGIIILPWQRQLPTELPKALVSAGSGRGIWPCGAPAAESLASPFLAVGSCWASAASATAQSANNSVLIASLLLCSFVRAPYPGACAEGTCRIIFFWDLQERS